MKNEQKNPNKQITANKKEKMQIKTFVLIYRPADLPVSLRPELLDLRGNDFSNWFVVVLIAFPPLVNKMALKEMSTFRFHKP